MADKDRFTFNKEERISGKIRINHLFTSGEAFLVYPFRVVYMKKTGSDTDRTTSVLISVPKKRLKRAVDRNRIKRLAREAYRLNKRLLVDSDDKLPLDIAFIYVADKLVSYQLVEKSITKALHILNSREMK